jgi:hypothetical protein
MSLKDNLNIKNVFLCFDNENAGQTVNKRIAEKLNSMNIQNEILVPNRKDWNEDLLFPNERGEEMCQNLRMKPIWEKYPRMKKSRHTSQMWRSLGEV